MKSKKVALYLRVSTDSQTTENQRLELASYCDRQGWAITQVYDDSGVSGAQHDRPALDQLIADAHQHKWDILAVWKIDRLARSVAHLLEVLTTLKSQNIGFCSITEAIDTTTPQGRMLLHFIGAISEFEREMIISRIRSGLDRARAQNIQLGRRRVGLDIGRAIELKRKGLGVRKIASQLNVSKSTVFNYLKSVQKSPA